MGLTLFPSYRTVATVGDDSAQGSPLDSAPTVYLAAGHAGTLFLPRDQIPDSWEES